MCSNPVLVSVSPPEAKPGIWAGAKSFCWGWDRGSAFVPLACVELTTAMAKSPGQPGPLSILPTWGALSLGEPWTPGPACQDWPTGPLWLPFRAPLSAPPGRKLCPSRRPFFLGLGFTFLYQVADQLVPGPKQVFWLLPETNQLRSRKSCPSPKSGKPQGKREMKQKGRQRRREREKRSKRKQEINKKKSNLVETSR